MADTPVIPVEFRCAPGSDTDLHRDIGKAYLRFLKRNAAADIDARDRFVIAATTALDHIRAFGDDDWSPETFAEVVRRVAQAVGEGLHRQHGKGS